MYLQVGICTAKWMRDWSLFKKKIPKQYDVFFLLFSGFVRVVNLKLFWQFWKSKQKQFHVHEPYKMPEYSNKLLHYFGNFEENIDLSCIHLAVPFETIYVYPWLAIITIFHILKMSHARISILKVSFFNMWQHKNYQ